MFLEEAALIQGKIELKETGSRMMVSAKNGKCGANYIYSSKLLGNGFRNERENPGNDTASGWNTEENSKPMYMLSCIFFVNEIDCGCSIDLVGLNASYR